MKIVLLPGLDGTGALFKPFIDSLPSNIDPIVIAYPTDLKLNYTELADYVIKRLPEEADFILLGESFSGPIAYDIALRKPNNMKAVIFVASFLSNPRPFLLGLSRALPKSFILSMPVPDFVAKMFLFGADVSDKMLKLFKQSLSKVAPGVLAHRLEEITSLTTRHKQCEIRVTYIQPTDDKLVPTRCVNEFISVMKNMNVFQVSGPHFILQTNPAACAAIVSNEIRLINEIQ